MTKDARSATSPTYEPAGWAPGDVAEVRYMGGGFLRAFRPSRRGWQTNTDSWLPDAWVTEARRLEVVDPATTVTLRPDNPDDVQRVADLQFWTLGEAEAFLRSLLPLSAPPEPNGLGAVVKGTTADGSGATWVRAIRNGGPAVWALSIPDPAGRERWWLWSAMRVTAVLSHGVGCSCSGPGCPGGEQDA